MVPVASAVDLVQVTVTLVSFINSLLQFYQLRIL